MPLKRLILRDLGPIDEVPFEFDDHVNVFVGPNNCGKTTAAVFLAFRNGIRTPLLQKLYSGRGGTEPPSMPPRISGAPYAEFVPALRFASDFRSPGPNTRSGSESLLGFGPGGPWKKTEENHSMLVSDEVVIQAFADLDYRSYRQNKSEIRDLLSATIEIASEVTEGFPLKYNGMLDDAQGQLYISLHTPDGDLPLGSLSQGTQSLFQWIARFVIGFGHYHDFPADLYERPAVLIVDEIDAHLHPSWQRRIIPALLGRFPNLQLFCTTHSPLMLAGLKAGQIQLMRRGEEGKVVVSRNEQDIVGWSSDEILRAFLDIPAPTDLKTEEDIARLQDLRLKRERSQEEEAEVQRLKASLSAHLSGAPLSGDVKELAEDLKAALGEKV